MTPRQSTEWNLLGMMDSSRLQSGPVDHVLNGSTPRWSPAANGTVGTSSASRPASRWITLWSISSHGSVSRHQQIERKLAKRIHTWDQFLSRPLPSPLPSRHHPRHHRPHWRHCNLNPSQLQGALSCLQALFGNISQFIKSILGIETNLYLPCDQKPSRERVHADRVKRILGTRDSERGLRFVLDVGIEMHRIKSTLRARSEVRSAFK